MFFRRLPSRAARGPQTQASSRQSAALSIEPLESRLVFANPVNTTPGTQTVASEGVIAFAPGDFSVFDADGDNLEVEITLNPTVVGNPIGTFSFGSTTGLTFTRGDGIDDIDVEFGGTQADINAALATLVLNAPTGPSQFNIVFETDDIIGAGGLADTNFTQVNVNANTNPINTTPGTQTIASEAVIAFAPGDFSVFDADGGPGGEILEVEITLNPTVVGNPVGTFSLLSTTGLTFTRGDGTDDIDVEFSGTQADINAALGTFVLTAPVGPSQFNIVFETDDEVGAGGLADTNFTQVNVNANTNPINTTPGTQTVASEGVIAFAPGDFSVFDADGEDLEVEITLNPTVVGNPIGTFTLGTTTGLTFTRGDGTDDIDVEFSGTQADINAALATLVLTAPTGPSQFNIVFETDDEPGAGGLSDTNFTQVNVSAATNPVNTTPGTQNLLSEQVLAFAPGAFSVFDADGGPGGEILEVEITLNPTVVGNPLGTFTLGTTTGLTFTRGDGLNDIDVEFSGTQADINAALATLVLAAPEGPTQFNIVFETDDEVGAGGLSDTNFTQVNVAANQAPVVVAGGDQTLRQNTSLALPGSFTVSDVESDVLEITLALSGTGGLGTITLGSTTGLAFTTGTGTGDATMVFTGSEADINAALATLSYNAPALANTVTLTLTADDQASTPLTDSDSLLLTTFENSNPVAGNDAFTVDRNSGPAIFDVLVNDTTAPDPGETLSIIAASQGNFGGIVQISGGGTSVSYQPAAGFFGTETFTYTIDDGFGGTATATVTMTVTVGGVFINPDSLIVTGPGKPSSGPHVQVFDGAGNVVASFFAFSPTFRGGVQVALGDVNGDGTSDVIVGAGPGGQGHVRVIDGRQLDQVNADGTIRASAILYTLTPFGSSFKGGVFVAAGDTHGLGHDSVIVGPGSGIRGRVRVFDGASGQLLASITPYGRSYTGGISVAAADFNGNGLADIVTGKLTGKGVVRIIDGTSNTVFRSFNSFGGFTGGVYVAAGDVTGDGTADVIVGADNGGAPRVRVFDGGSGAQVSSFLAFESSFRGGVRVGTADVDGDGNDEILVSSGAGRSPEVKAFEFNEAVVESFFAYDRRFNDGVFVN